MGIVSCAMTLQECSQASYIAQSAIAQCTVLAEQLSAQLDASHTNHIAHAIAVFSELGLGIAAAAIIDPLKWRERATQISADAVARQDLLSQAKMMGGFVRNIIRFVTIPHWGWVKFYFFPFLSVFIACSALFGISGLLCHINDKWWLFFSGMSFVISMILPAIMTTAIREQPKIKETLDETLKTEIN